MRISLNGSDWQLQGWIPQEWELVGVRQIVTANLDIGKMLAGDTAVIPATVPGCVQADLLRAKVIDDPYVGLHSRECEWAAQRNWLYQKLFTLPPDLAGRKLRLICRGIDYSGRIWLNGMLLGRHEGTFIPAEFDITGVARPGDENHLAIMIDPAPDVPGQIGYSNQVRRLKPRFSYKWDFTTRLVQLGLWDDVEIAATGPAHIDNAWVRTELTGADARACVRAAIVSAQACEARLEIRLKLGGTVVAEGETDVNLAAGENTAEIRLSIPEPQTWWPNGLGDQPVYSAEIALRGPGGEEWDSTAVTFGLRTIEMVQNEDAPAGADPYTMVVNGRKVYLRGWNFVPVDHMYGLANEQKYQWLIELARRANVNMLRIWGGGIIEKDIFYDLCDKAGILVWQEMPQSSSGLSNDPPTEPSFLETLKAVARSALRRLRNHPSLAVWCGGNELADGLDPLDATHPNLAAIGEVVREEAPHLVYRPTSPYGPVFDPKPDKFGKGLHHDIHGPWEYQGVQAQYDLCNGNDCLFHSEAGAEGCADVHSIQRCLREESLHPFDKTNRACAHHAGWWLNRSAMNSLFGEIDSLEDYVAASQFAQAEALRYLAESDRRRKFRCSGGLLWQLNEPWPNVSATPCVDWYGVAKPAYYWVSRAWRPRHASLRYSRLDQQPGERFDAEIFLHNSLGEIAADVRCTIFDMAGSVLFDDRRTMTLPENCCISAGGIDWSVPKLDIFIVRLSLIAGGVELVPNEYIFTAAGAQPPLAPLANLPPADINIAAPGAAAAGVVCAVNNGGVAALMTAIQPDRHTLLHVEGNARVLLPGETAEFRLHMREAVDQLDTQEFAQLRPPHKPIVTLNAWNGIGLIIEI